MRCAYLLFLPHCTRFSITRLSNSSFDSPILMYTYFSRIKIDQVMRSATFLFRGVTIGTTGKIEVLPNFSSRPSGPISQWVSSGHTPAIGQKISDKNAKLLDPELTITSCTYSYLM